MIGSLYSQFAERKTRIEGETQLDATGLNVYTEANQTGKTFIMLGETQNLITDTSNPVFVELVPDEYETN